LTGELETAAADSAPHLWKRKAKHAPAPGATCANCGAVLQGAYCHVCGQNADPHHRSILHLIWEALESLFELDGRLWRTLPALFFRPGRLARDYMEGRVARHVPPFRTFLIALLLFIFAAEHAAHEMTLANERHKAAQAAELATPQGRAAASARALTEAAKDRAEALADAASDRAEGLREGDQPPAQVQAAYAKAVDRAQAANSRALARADGLARGQVAAPQVDVNIETVNGKGKTSRNGALKTGIRKAIANPEYYLTVLFTWAHRAAIVLLPIVGLTLALVYRRRREIFLYDHLLVAMNLLSFQFLTAALGLVLPVSLMGYWFGLTTFWTPVNLFQTLRGAYGSSIVGAVLKTVVVWGVTALAFSVLLTALMFVAVIEL